MMQEQRVPWWRADLGEAEAEAVARAIRARRVSQGSLCEEFERRLAAQLGVPHVTVTTSGSVALVLALLACEVGPGDEVIVPAAGFIAPAHAARLIGARVRLADLGASRPLIDPDSVAAAITPRTRAVVAIHLNGRACDLERLHEATAVSGAMVVEDCAQAFLSRDVRGFLGTRSTLAAFSMGITKLLTTAEGGFVVSVSAELRERLARLRNHGTLSIARNVFDAPGCNFRLTDLQAAIGLAQLERLESKVDGVRSVYRYYRERLAGLPFIRMLEVDEDAGELPLWAEVECVERERVVQALADRRIEAKPFHPCLADSPHLGVRGEFPNAERIASRGLVLPSGPDQREVDLERTVAALRGLAPTIRQSL
jgi:dTDP-4-amino-4,6-dideoxygalactose transaminase